MLTGVRNYKKKNEEYITYFKGLNKSEYKAEGELSNVLNMSSDYFPCLSSRKKRLVVKEELNGARATALGSGKKQYWTEGLDFFYDGVKKGTIENAVTSFVNFNDWVLIFPDKKYYDTTNDIFGSLEAEFRSDTATFTTNSIIVEGTDYNNDPCFLAEDCIKITDSDNRDDGNFKTIILKRVAINLIENTTEFIFADNSFVEETAENVILRREVPDIDYAVEYQNRVWSCKGDNIYASRLGDCRNFNVFEGTTLDSWATNTGTLGDFTGVVSMPNRLVFFKENTIHELYGSVPSTFSLSVTASLGCKQGCYRSLAVINNYIYYMSIKGIMRYYSGNPELISIPLRLSSNIVKAVAGTDYRKYYISLTDEKDQTSLYVFDTYNLIWLQEEPMKTVEFDTFEGELYAITEDKFYKLNVNSEESEEFVKWSFETEEFTEVVHNKKLLSAFSLKADIKCQDNLRAYISINNGQWQRIEFVVDPEYRTYFYYLKPQRVERCKFKFEGIGEAKIYSLSREFFVSSKVR